MPSRRPEYSAIFYDMDGMLLARHKDLRLRSAPWYCLTVMDALALLDRQRHAARIQRPGDDDGFRERLVCHERQIRFSTLGLALLALVTLTRVVPTWKLTWHLPNRKQVTDRQTDRQTVCVDRGGAMRRRLPANAVSLFA